MRQLEYLKDVVTLKFDWDKCVGCGMCTMVCPQAVFKLDNGKVRIGERDHCMECGACAKNCPSEAISVQVGVGCAAAVINTALGRKNAACCCTLNPEDDADSTGDNKGSCC
ncbi:mercury methylation ferredoxin HgcB [Thermodesulfobacteriota bacterium]